MAKKKSYKFEEKNIPKKHKTKKEKIKFLIGKIRKGYLKIHESEKTKTLMACKMGWYFITLKSVVKKDGKKWIEYLNGNFPYLTERTIQRYMELTDCFDPNEYPALGYLGMNDIKWLYMIANKYQSEKIQEDNDDVDLDEDNSTHTQRDDPIVEYPR